MYVLRVAEIRVVVHVEMEQTRRPRQLPCEGEEGGTKEREKKQAGEREEEKIEKNKEIGTVRGED